MILAFQQEPRLAPGILHLTSCILHLASYILHLVVLLFVDWYLVIIVILTILVDWYLVDWNLGICRLVDWYLVDYVGLPAPRNRTVTLTWEVTLSSWCLYCQSASSISPHHISPSYISIHHHI